MKLRIKLVSLVAVAATAVTLAGVQAYGQRAHPFDPTDSDGSSAVWNAKCNTIVDDDYDHSVQQIDPVVNFNRARSRHLHVFFGHRNMTTTTTAEELNNRGILADLANSCGLMTPHLTEPYDHAHPDADRAIDNSAYWVPVLNDGPCSDGGVVTDQSCTDQAPVTVAIPYYRSGDFSLADHQGHSTTDDLDAIHPLPTNIEMMAGDPMNSGSSASEHIKYSCVDPNTPNETAVQNSIPHYCPDYGTNTQLRMTVAFPNCMVEGYAGPDPEHHSTVADQNWNNSDEIDPANRDMDYNTLDGDQKATCSHSAFGDTRTWVAIPQVRIGVRWKISTAFTKALDPTVGHTRCGTAFCYDLSNAYLSSDHQSMFGMPTSGLHGVTGHADFINGWSEADLLTFMHMSYWHCHHTDAPNYGPRQIGFDHHDPAIAECGP